MSGYILRENDPSIVLTADQVDRLVKNGDGDAALLYLLLMRADRGITEQELQSRLRWSQLRLNAAETGLQRLGLIQRPAETPPPAPAEERPVYSAQDLAALLEDDRSFRMLIPQVEEKLGRKLKTADLQVLAGLYDDLGMPADVIYLLVNHCITRSEERYGPGRRPTLREGGLLLGPPGPVRPGQRRPLSENLAGQTAGPVRLYAGAGPGPAPPGGQRGKVHLRLDGQGLPAGNGGPGLRQDHIL